MSLESCDRHDDAVIVFENESRYTKRQRKCPFCVAERERDEAQDECRTLNDKISDLESQINQENA